MTPAKISNKGKSAPRLISIGRKKLSRLTTIRLQTNKNIAQPVSPCQNIQPTAGNSTKLGPSCAIQSISITADNIAAKGTPAITKPRPPSTVCTIAVTPTPNATARIACPANTIAPSPRSPARRRPKLRTILAASSPDEYKIAEMVTTNKN